MIANIILGVNIDTEMWISELERESSENIIVIDYDYFGEPILKNEVTYLSPCDAKSYLAKFDSLNFYKSVYAYPGMKGKMSSLYKK